MTGGGGGEERERKKNRLGQKSPVSDYKGERRGGRDRRTHTHTKKKFLKPPSEQYKQQTLQGGGWEDWRGGESGTV